MVEVKNFSRYITFVVFTILVFTGFVWRLIDWQIVNGEFYHKKANQNNIFIIETKAARGEILDINGEGFAVNLAGYMLVFDRFYMEEKRLNEIIEFFIDLFERKGEKWEDILPIALSKNGKYSFLEDKPEDNKNLNNEGKSSSGKKGKIANEIEILKSKDQLNLNSYATAEDCMKKLLEKYNCGAYPPKKARDIASVRYNMSRSGYHNSMTKSYTFANNISQEMVMIVSEHTGRFPGVDIRSSVIREYVNGAVAPHIVGLVGALSAEDYEELKDKGYRLDDTIGRSGIERKLEDKLRGKSGKKTVEMDMNGEIINQVINQDTTPGNTVFLTIDSHLQNVANESLKRNVEAAHYSAADCLAGGAVVLSIKDFSVLAAATYPSYDLSKFASDQKYLSEVIIDEKYKPLLNRALNGQFTPGSIFKPLIACAGLQEGVITPNSAVGCYGGWQLPGTSSWSGHVTCRNHGGRQMNLFNAITYSCNSYFSDTGYKLGIDNINIYGKRFGLGTETGIEIEETSGIIANPARRQRLGVPWTAMEVPKAAYGQSDNAFSPLQLAAYVATIATDGKRYRTHLVRKITNYMRNEVILENDPENPELVAEAGVSKEHFEEVKKGMYQVTVSGTARGFSGYSLKVGAKTGTAEIDNANDNITFICFAPYENPEIAISVVIEHGRIHHCAMNVAKDILNAYFHKADSK